MRFLLLCCRYFVVVVVMVVVVVVVGVSEATNNRYNEQSIHEE